MDLNEVADYWEQVVKINNWQQKEYSRIIIKNLFGTLSNKKIVILGFHLKQILTIQESPSIEISRDLLKEGANLIFYDPKVSKEQIINELKGINSDGKLFF